MKMLKKTLLASAMALTAITSFAQSSQAGIDPTGEGVIHITGVAVGSCTAPTFTVDLSSIDMHTSINGALGTYEKQLVLPVICTNPNQNWTILPAVRPFDVGAGVTETYIAFQNGEGLTYQLENYVAIVSTTSVAGTIMTMNDSISGIGTQAVNAKAIFGKTVPENTNGLGDGSSISGDPVEWFVNANMGIPMGTIDNRGTFSVEIPLVIMY